MRKHTAALCSAFIACSFLYLGSAYMSQSFRLMERLDGSTVDLVTSVLDYLLQAAGIAAFCMGFKRKPRIFGSKRVIVSCLAASAALMAVAQLAQGLPAILAANAAFNLLVGFCSAHYLCMLARCAAPGSSGTIFGAAYAAASVGSYLLSKLRDGAFLASPEAAPIYLLLAAGSIALALLLPELDAGAAAATPQAEPLGLLLAIVALMTVVSAVGSGLYYALPGSESVDWNLIRAFYAAGLLLGGAIMDRKRFAGEICAIASLTYPLVFFSLVGDGLASSAAMSMSYFFRGFITLYYVLSFTDIASRSGRLWVAPLGLMASRAAEALISLPLVLLSVPQLVQLIFAAICFMLLVGLFVGYEARKYAAPAMSKAKRLALFSARKELTARESEVLGLLEDGLTDAEIAERCFISNNTVRFHISNLLRKLGASSRVEAVRMLEGFE